MAPGPVLAGVHGDAFDAEALSAADLVGLVAGESARVRVAALLGERGLSGLSRAHPAEWRALGFAPAAALRLAAAFELGRRSARARLPARPRLGSARAVYELLSPQLRGLEQESFRALLLDGKHRLRRAVAVSGGTLTSSLVHPREVFGPAVRECAAAIIVAHNHPSGDPEPSREDLDVTRRLMDAGVLLGIPLLDHVVLGDGRYCSLRERIGSGP